MRLSYDERKLKGVVAEFRKRQGIEEIRVWINRGDLRVGLWTVIPCPVRVS